MITVSARFREALRASHQVVTKLEVLDAAGVLISDSLAPTGGSVQLDRKGAYRRTLSVEFADPDLIPDQVSDLLSPYGNQIRVWTGIRYPDTTTELVRLGTFRIQSVDGDRTLGGINATGYSSAATVAQDQFLTPKSSNLTLTVQEQIAALIVESVPSAVVLQQGTTDRPMTKVVWESDRWKAIAGDDDASLAVSIGAEVWLNHLDEFRVRNVPALTNPPVATISSGPGGALVAAPVELSRDGVHNAWVVRGESAGQGTPPVQAIEYDDDPLSVTRWNGPVGRVPGFHTSSTLTTQAQCFVVAQALLADSLGLAKSVDLSAIPDPTLEPGDVITIAYPDGRSEDHLLDTVEIPLVADGQFSCQTRAQTYQAT